MTKNTLTSEEATALENQYGTHNYHPLPVVLNRGRGVYMWDVEGKHYLDFLSSYSTVDQGHYHSRIIKTLTEQAQTPTLTSRVFYNDKLDVYGKYVTEYFGSEKVFPINIGAKAVGAVIRTCRRWAYEQKGVPGGAAIIIVCEQNFHGRATTVVSFSSDKNAHTNFEPYTPGFVSVPYNDLVALERILAENATIVAGSLVGPIQSEAGAYMPSEGYLSGTKVLCERCNTLFMADKVQTGVACTGKRLAIDYEDVRPDILVLGKAISGGVCPVSTILADDRTVHVIKAGQHGSTFRSNPLIAAVAIGALQVVRDEQLAEGVARLGEIFRRELSDYIRNSKVAILVRSKGLLNAVVINDTEDSDTAWNIYLRICDNGLLAESTHGNIIRFTPPLVMNGTKLRECINIVINTLKEFES